MARIPQRFIDDLLDRVDIVDIVGTRIDLRKSGKNYSARCPFHNEKTPSFTVSPEKQFYYCFGCGAGGNAIGFVMDHDRLGFPEAVEVLAHHCGMEVPKETSTEPHRDSQRQKLYTILDKANHFYRQQLRNHPRAHIAIDYLKSRGVSGEIARDFAIGYAPEGWENLVKQLGESNEQLSLLVSAGLAVHKEGETNRCYDRFRHRIVFPIHDTRGRTIGFGGRVLDDSKPKYLNTPETPVFHKGRELYGLYQARRQLGDYRYLLVVEGYMDVVALAQHGIHNAVATLGTAATKEHVDKLFRYTPEIVFCFDGDDAGRRAAKRAMETCLPASRDGHSARFLFLPEGEDPDTLVRKLGREGFCQLIDRARPLSEFLFTTLGEGLDQTIPEGKARLRDLAAPLISLIPEGVYRQLLLKELAKRTDMDIEALNALQQATTATTEDHPPRFEDSDDHYADYPELSDMEDDRYTQTSQRNPNLRAREKRLKLSAIQRLILLLLHAPTLRSEIEQLGHLELLDDPEAETLAQLCTLLKTHPEYSLNHILGYWRGIYGPEKGEALARIIASDLLTASQHSVRDDLAEFRDIYQHLEKRMQRLKSPREQLESLLSQEELSPDDHKHLLYLWHSELPQTERTAELKKLIKQVIANKKTAKIKS